MITFRQPFKGEYPITQQYGEVIPGVTYQGKPHTGIDYGCPTGTKILASADGTVMAVGWDHTGYGYRVIIRHTADKSTLYAHLEGHTVKYGQKVKKGDVIGVSGATGGTAAYPVTGPHLHFEARRTWDDYNSHFDPMLLPLMSVDDTIGTDTGDSRPEEEAETVPEIVRIKSGIYRVACEAAYVRNWESLRREKLIYNGELVYVFDQVKEQDGLTFYYIGAGSAMAAVDSEGTILLEKYNGKQKK